MGSERQAIRRQKFAIFGLVALLVFAVTGIGVAQGLVGPPTTIHTCTNNKSGKTTLKPTCSSKQTGKSWDSRYLAILQEGGGSAGTTDFTGLDLSGGLWLPPLFGIGRNMNFSGDNFSGSNLIAAQGVDFQNANFTGATFYGDGYDVGLFNSANFNGANFTNATFGPGAASFNFSNATFVGAIWNNTTCPDGTNSNSDGGTCEGGHGIP
jgi:hypothetical protein